MRFLADLHLHSRFSRATSKDMTFETLAAWANVKGLALLGTADFTHPDWWNLTKRKLEPAGNGLFRLKKPERRGNAFLREFSRASDAVHFLLSAEISFVYAEKEKTHRIHLVVLAPGRETVEKIRRRLGKIGNLRADGRPVLRMSAARFTRMIADIDPRCLVIPAHIWTPWFSLFGSKSGFDSIEDCFGDMTSFVAALETGLSADPRMIRRVSALDRFSLVSNSDAHSPAKIGREANAFDTDFSYPGVAAALKSGDPAKFLYTVEFYPEEGKYYADGHRKCGVVLVPGKSRKKETRCPVCGKALTPGVRRRVEELADRPAADARVPSRYLVPLEEIIGAARGQNPGCASVREDYFRLIREFGNEHRILTEVPTAEIRRLGPERIALGIERVRSGKARVSPGYDGFYGRVQIFRESDRPFRANRPVP
ncbi:MAG: endonuclease Q family protein [Candidatus Aminicenantales bacterium]